MTQERTNSIDLTKFLNSQSKILKNKGVFEPYFKPETIIHREKEIEQLIGYFLPVIKRDSSCSKRFRVIQGKEGQGKSLLVNFIGNLLVEYCNQNQEELNVKLHFFHFNCRLISSPFLLLTSILRQLVPGFAVRGFSTEELFEFLMQILIETPHFRILLCLDEVDHLLFHTKGKDLIYSLVRQYENYSDQNPSIPLFLITRNVNFSQQFDSSIQFNLAIKTMKIPEYSTNQIYDILEHRAKKGLYIESYSFELLQYIAVKGEGKAQRAIDLLWLCATRAEDEKNSEITLNHAKNAYKSLLPVKKAIVLELPSYLRDVFLSVVNFFQRDPERSFVTTSEIYPEYEEYCQLKQLKCRKQTQFWHYLHRLAKLNLISLEVVNEHTRTGRSKGRITQIKINIPFNEVESLLPNKNCTNHFSNVNIPQLKKSKEINKK